MASRKEVDQIVAFLFAHWPLVKTQQPMEAVTAAWHMSLQDLPAEGLLRAAMKVCETSTFFPSCGELRRAYFQMGETAAELPSGQDAWAHLNKLLHRGFSWLRPPCDEDYLNELQRKALDVLGGWSMFCTSEDGTSDRMRFLQAYDVYLEREREQERMSPAVRQYIEQLAAKMKDQAQLGPGVNR